MWLINTEIMCRQHLLGEHLECHMFVSHINKQKSIRGYLDNNLLEPLSLTKRHNQLVKEMIQRGYHHKSPLNTVNLSYLSGVKDWKINIDRSLKELLKRCNECQKRYKQRVKK